jgi:hypothetical protein
MAGKSTKKLAKSEQEELLSRLEERFEANKDRHKGVQWEKVRRKLEAAPASLWALSEMERTGGEPDVIGQEKSGYLFVDCSAESPAGRRSLCYDGEALKARKQNKPKGSAVEMAAEMGTELLTEEEYRQLQEVGEFDAKTSSWLTTPSEVRKLGGAIFGDYRFGAVWIYHNGADSYYAARGFRCAVRV